MTLLELSQQIHRDNVDKGFYDELRDVPDESLKNHTELFIFKQILLTITELSEAAEYLRKHEIDLDLEPNQFNELTYQENNELFRQKFKDTFQDEIADTFIRLFDLVGFLGFDIDKWIDAKLRYNKSREYLHGKRY